MDPHGTPIALVTGSTSGIGTALAEGLAHSGHRVILHGREATRAERLHDRLIREIPDALIDIAITDLSSLDEVRRLGSRVCSRYDRLDVCIHNAGTYNPVCETTSDGIETTLAVNHLAPFLLTETLRPLLERSPGARIVTVSSRAHHVARLDLEDLGMERLYLGVLQYANTKLMNLLWTRRLAATFDPAQVTVNAFHPGFVDSRLARRTLVLDLLFRLGSSPKRGADTGLWLATDPALEAKTGGFYARRRPARASRTARDDALADRLWKKSHALTSR